MSGSPLFLVFEGLDELQRPGDLLGVRGDVRAERVAERARDLLHREQKEQAWKDFLVKLRSEAKIVIQAPGKATASVK